MTQRREHASFTSAEPSFSGARCEIRTHISRICNPGPKPFRQPCKEETTDEGTTRPKIAFGFTSLVVKLARLPGFEPGRRV